MLQSEENKKISGKSSKGSSAGLTTSHPRISSHTRTTFSSTPQSNPVKQTSLASKPVNNTVSLGRGDTLWEIAQKKLGNGSRWQELRKADGSRFKPQEVRHLQVGTRVSVPWTKPTTKTPHPVTSLSHKSDFSVQVLPVKSTSWSKITASSTPLMSNNQFSTSPALFSRTPQVSSQVFSTEDITRFRYDTSASYHRRSTQSGSLSDSTNNDLNLIGGIAKGVAVGKFVAARRINQTAATGRLAADVHLPATNGTPLPNLEVAERPAADMFRKRLRSTDTKVLSHPHSTRGVPRVGWDNGGRETAKEDAAKILRNAADNSKDPVIKNLLEEKILEQNGRGEWKIQGRRYAMGHVGASRHSGRREMFALEDSKPNSLDGSRRERKGEILQKRAVLVRGIPFPIELQTARRMERDGELPKGSVKNALPHPGYTRQSVEKEIRGSTRYTREVKVTDHAIDKIRDKLFLESELKKLTPKEQKQLKDKIATGKVTDADIRNPEHLQRIRDMRELVPRVFDRIRDEFLESELKKLTPEEQKLLKDKIAAGKATDADLLDPQHKQRIWDMRKLAPDKAIDKIRDQLFLESELKERSPQEQKRLKDKIAAGKATDADLRNPEHLQRIRDMRELAKKPSLSEPHPSSAILRTHASYTESLYAIAPANIRAARAGDDVAYSTRAVGIGRVPRKIVNNLREQSVKVKVASRTKVLNVAKSIKNSKSVKPVIQRANTVKNSVVQPARLKTREVTNTVRNSKPATAVARRVNIIRNSSAANRTLGVTRKVTQSGVTKGVLRGASRVAAPVGIALDTWQLGSAYKKHGFGKEFRKEAGRVAGGWGGAAAGAAGGAALGSVVPVVGTAAGAIVGGIIGGVAGSEFGDDIEQGAEKAGKAIVGGAKKAWNKFFG